MGKNQVEVMKPYGREKKITQNPSWKKDYHLHKLGRKVENWWESIADFDFRTEIKRKVKKDIEEQINEYIAKNERD